MITRWQPPDSHKGRVVDLRLQDGTEVPCCYRRGDTYICCLKNRDHSIHHTQVAEVRLTWHRTGAINR